MKSVCRYLFPEPEYGGFGVSVGSEFLSFGPNGHIKPIFGTHTSNDHTQLLKKEKITFYIFKGMIQGVKKSRFFVFLNRNIRFYNQKSCS